MQHSLYFKTNSLIKNCKPCFKLSIKTFKITKPKFSDKWYMPESIYPSAYYPHYCFGYSTLFSDGCLQSLIVQAQQRSSQFLHDFWIDDVLYSGILAQEVKYELEM